jgi:hypothetical protein
MIVSNKHQFVMLLPWKTASSTAHARLELVNESPYERFYDFNPYLQRVVHQHLCYSDFQLLPESVLKYYVGAFVRNPYDRVYSGFVQLQRDIQSQPNQPFAKAWVKDLVMRQLSENFAQLAAADFDFNRWVSSISEYQIYDVGRNSSLPLHPAHYWTGPHAQRAVDFVGKVETFEADFSEFCASVGVEVDSKSNENVTTSISARHEAGRPRYLERMSKKTISKINELFNVDFGLFNYERFTTPE